MPDPTMTVRSLKVTAVLDPQEVALLPEPPPGRPRAPLRLSSAGRVYVVDLNAKAVRRALKAIGEGGPDGVSCIIQGKLVENRIDEAGIIVQPKVPKPVPVLLEEGAGM